MKRLGGQAVIEGVMIRSPEGFVVVVRGPDGRLKSLRKRFNSATRNGFWSKPFLRGVAALWETFYLGAKALSWSSRVATGEGKGDSSKAELVLTVAFSLLIVLAVFKFLPLLLANSVRTRSAVAFNMLEGLVKASILVAYLWAFSFLKDVRRTYQYHGAEHKAIRCYEAGKPLTVGNVQAFPKEHPRCGTSFALLVVLVSVFFYVFIPLGMQFWEKYLLRVALLPVIAGASYELVRLSGGKGFPGRVLAWPGALLQRITTAEPEDDMVRVAINAVRMATRKNKKNLNK